MSFLNYNYRELDELCLLQIDQLYGGGEIVFAAKFQWAPTIGALAMHNSPAILKVDDVQVAGYLEPQNGYFVVNPLKP